MTIALVGHVSAGSARRVWPTANGRNEIGARPGRRGKH